MVKGYQRYNSKLNMLIIEATYMYMWIYLDATLYM